MNLRSVLNPTPSFASLSESASQSAFAMSEVQPSSTIDVDHGTGQFGAPSHLSSAAAADANLLTVLSRQHGLDEMMRGLLSTFQMVRRYLQSHYYLC